MKIFKLFGAATCNAGKPIINVSTYSVAFYIGTTVYVYIRNDIN